MKLLQLSKLVTFLLSLLVLQACGGSGGSDTNGSILLTVPATVNAGQPIQAIATFTSTRGVQALPITFSSSDPNVVIPSTNDTNSSGIATAQLTTRNIINGDRTVVITASNGGVTGSSSVVIRANKLVFNSPATASFTVTAGSSLEYFISGGGSLVTYTDADGRPLAGKSIKLLVNNITPGITDVLFHSNLTNTSFRTVNPFTLTTLSDGSLSNSIVSVIATAPGTVGAKSDYSVNFIVSVFDPGFGDMSISGDLPFSITAQ